MAFVFKHKLEYHLDTDDREQAIYDLVDLIRRDWPYYADEGTLTRVPKKGKKLRKVKRNPKYRKPTSLSEVFP